MKFDFLVSKNTYNTTAYFAKSLSAALQKEGATLRTFWIDNEYFFQAFYEILENPPDLTLSFSDIRMENISLADLWQIPHLSLLIDPAIYFLHHLKSPFSMVSSVDEGDVSFIRALGFKKTFFLPHGADAKETTPIEGSRPFDAVFFGTCIDFDELQKNWEKKYSLKIQKTLLEAATNVLQEEDLSILKALQNLQIKEEDLPLFHYEVDLYVRGKDRVDLLSGKKVHIWGEGPWGKYCERAQVHPPVSFDKTLEIMKQSKIVFNSSPRFKCGSHERLFYAPLCGAAVVSRLNSYIKKAFSEDEIIPTSCEMSEALSIWKKVAEKSQKRVLQEHTWDDRAKEILTFLQQLREVSPI